MKDIKDKKIEDLTKMLSVKREALRSFRFNISGSKQKNVKEGSGYKKEIARIMTEISRRKSNKSIGKTSDK